MLGFSVILPGVRISWFGGEKRKPKKKIKKKVKNLKIPLTYNHYCSILNTTVVII